MALVPKPAPPPPLCLEPCFLQEEMASFLRSASFLSCFHISLETLQGTKKEATINDCWWNTWVCLTLWDPIDCSRRGFSIHGILQARILEWVTVSFSRGSSRPRDRTQVSHISGRRFNLCTANGKTKRPNPCPRGMSSLLRRRDIITQLYFVFIIKNVCNRIIQD